ncbi:MAG: hypothetical protein IMF05_06885 [Proteobacteria bacterium]|nr:hypothetical protein [Pseudomonadota bacterium]
MGGFYDVYVLSGDRSKATVVQFFDRFLPERKETADDYPVPRYSDSPEICLDTADELLTYLEHHPDEPHSIYWASQASGDPYHAMLFATTDGHAVYGLSVVRNEREYLASLMAFLNSANGYIDFEYPPPDSAPKFEKKMVDGVK